jgi:outer membrane protein OmpA-like peptidoglycan-associated protein
MKLFSKFYLLFVIIFLAIINYSFSQVKSDANGFIQQNLIISLEGGVSFGYTDYKTSNYEPAIRGSIEYFPLIINNARLGIKAFGGGLKISQTDSRGTISTNDGQRTVPVNTYTDIIQIGGVIDLGYALSNSLIARIGFGGAYLNFSPKNMDGTQLEYNSKDVYSNNIFTFIIDGGIKYKISDRFSISASINYYPTQTDYLEDVSAAKQNDSFIAGMIGLSYAFIGNFDSDKDGIIDKFDLCPNEPEDFDGFEDEDGCPDLDNDGDGILDINDKCPNEAEDFDGFQDEDGCPDPDNDGDGILDINDKCPDEAEDLDGFQDEDGCPDSDNDGDEILDINDKCPDEPETINKFEDEDGCPDTSPTEQETFYQFILRGDDTFASNSSANLKDGAKLLLNEIAFYIQNQPGSKWRIEGHMDSQGAASTIKKLSYDRAKTVLDYLISKGIPSDQFTLYGLGDSFPIANNNIAEGRSTNRRIVIIRED